MRVFQDFDYEAGEARASVLDRPVEDAGDEQFRVEGKVDDFTEELIFGCEVVDDERGVDAGASGDRTDRRSLETVLTEFDLRGREDPIRCLGPLRST